MKISNGFLLRKLHQLTGVVPLGIFFVVHMLTNSKALNGEKVFEHAVQDIHDIPFLPLVEIFGIFIPLLFHSVYGIMISSEMRLNRNYNYGSNWFYLLQRISGAFLFFFILFHLLSLRFGLLPMLGLTDIAVAGNAHVSYDIVAKEFSHVWVIVVYILGVAATAWHFGYGLWLFALDFGLVIGEKAQKMALYACLAIAFSMFAVGTNAAISFVRPCGLMPSVMCENSSEKLFDAREKEEPKKGEIKK